MNEKQFDWLDDRFREAADQHEPPFDEASWQKLEGMLDNSKPKRRVAWWWFTDALILGLLVLIAYYLVNPGTNSSTTMSKGEAVVAETKTSIIDPATVSPAPLITSTDVSTSSQSQTIADRSSVAYDRVQTDFSIASRRLRSGQTTASQFSGDSQDAAIVVKDLSHDAGQVNAAKTDAIDNSVFGAASTQQKTGIVDDKASYLTTEQMEASPAEADATIAKDNLTKDKDAAVENALPPSVADKKTADKNSAQKGFYIYAMGGPEWSMVAGNEAGNATFAWGLGMGYRFSPKWAVQAGYFKTQKVYAAGQGDYKPKPGTYYYNLTIKNVEAECHITEIPIALSYTLLNTRKQNLFATVGLSSYIMKSEEYHYDYIRANSTPGYSKYQYQTNNSHLFAGLLLSGGYSFRLFDGFSLSAEPYVKVPLYGVGEGSVKITSFGVMAGARYSLPSFRRK